MPWEIRSNNGRHCVYKKGGDTPLKCYTSEDKAKAYLKALYANSPDTQGSIIFEQVNGPIRFDIQASDNGRLLVFKNAILARAETNKNGDTITQKGIEELAATLAGMPIDFEHQYNEIRGAFTAGHAMQDGALSTDGFIWADRFPKEAEGVQSGAYGLSVEAGAETATCSVCGEKFLKADDYCPHLVGRRRGGATRLVEGLVAKGGAITERPAATDPRFDLSSIYFVASHQETDVNVDADLIAAELDICVDDVLIDVFGKALSTEQRKNLDDSQYALPDKRRFPINDCEHARKALQLLPKAKDLSDEERATVERKAKAKLAKCNKENETRSSNMADEKPQNVEDEEKKEEENKKKETPKDADKGELAAAEFEKQIAELKSALEQKEAELKAAKESVDSLTANLAAANAETSRHADRAKELESKVADMILRASFDEKELPAIKEKVKDWKLDQIEVLASTRNATPQRKPLTLGLPAGDTARQQPQPEKLVLRKE